MRNLLVIGLGLVLAGWVVEHLVFDATARSLGRTMSPLVVEAELEAEAQRSLTNFEKRGGDVQLGHLVGTRGEVERRFAVDVTEAKLDAAEGGAESVDRVGLASRLGPLLWLLRLLGMVLILFAVLKRVRQSEPESRQEGWLHMGAGGVVVYVLLFDASALVGYQITASQIAMAAFVQYQGAVSDLEAQRASVERELKQLDEGFELPPTPQPVMGVDDLMRQAEADQTAAALEAEMRQIEEASAKEEALWEAREVFGAYGMASAMQNGASMAQQLLPSSLERYRTILDAARRATRDELAELPAWDRALVGILRVRHASEELATLSVEDVLADEAGYGFWLGWTGSGAGFVEEATLDGDTGSLLIAPLEGSPVHITIERTDGAWKMDVTPLLAEASRQLVTRASEAGVDLETFLLGELTLVSPTYEVDPKLWDGPRK